MTKAKKTSIRSQGPGFRAKQARAAAKGGKARKTRDDEFFDLEAVADPTDVVEFMKEHDSHIAQVIEKFISHLKVVGWTDVERMIKIKGLALDNSRKKMDLMNARKTLLTNEQVQAIIGSLLELVDTGLAGVKECLRTVRIPAKAKKDARDAIQVAVESMEQTINTKMRRKS